MNTDITTSDGHSFDTKATQNETDLDYFRAGGTLPPDTPSYITRPADDELYKLVQDGQFCYVLTTRQMGKSSLMTRTAQRLSQNNISFALIDLTAGMDRSSQEAWYRDLISLIAYDLDLTTDPNTWFEAHATTGSVRRFTNFLRDVVLTEISGQVVIFIDEIDSTLQINFRDDFFAAIRAVYNARASNPELNRLTFVLLGVASPTDLIADRSRTPFNIGHAVDLREFGRDDAGRLQQGMETAYPKQGGDILDRIFYWTNGHPYLTQRLCVETISRNGSQQWSTDQLDTLVEQLFLSEETRKETNLKFIRDNVDNIQDPAFKRRMLRLYRKVYQGQVIEEDERSVEQNKLKLIGLVGVKKGHLQVRNRIYERVFNQTWIESKIPIDWNRRIAIGATVVALLLTLIFGGYVWLVQQPDEVLAQTFTENFSNTSNPTLRLSNLANLFNLADYDENAHQLFNSLSPAEQLALFEQASPDLQAEIEQVVQEIYIGLDNSSASTTLLQAMKASLENVSSSNTSLVNEIEHWLEGRSAVEANNFDEAKIAYRIALGLNEANPATHFELAKVLTQLGETEAALTEYEAAITLDENRIPATEANIEQNQQLYTTLWANRSDYPGLIAIIPTPTNTPTATSTQERSISGILSTATPSPSSTFTPTPIPTETPTPTETFTPLPPTSTPTNTPSPTPVRTLFGRIAFPVDNGNGSYDVWVKELETDIDPYLQIRNASQPNYSVNGELLVKTSEGIGYLDRNGSLIGIISDSVDDSHPYWDPEGNRYVYDNTKLLSGHHESDAFIFIPCSLTRPSLESEPNCRNIAANGVLKTSDSEEMSGEFPVWMSDNMIAFRRSEGVAITDRIIKVERKGEDASGIKDYDFEVILLASQVGQRGIQLLPSESTIGNVRRGIGQLQQVVPLGIDGRPTDTFGDQLFFFSSDITGNERAGDWEAYSVKVGNSEAFNLSKSHESSDGMPTVSPDGQWVAFVSNRGGNWGIWVTSADGNEEAILIVDISPIQVGSTPWGTGERDWTTERISWGP